MRFAEVSLTDFRNYTQFDLVLCPGINILLGRNGHGKTNFVEALGYLATLSSHRVSSDLPLVRSGVKSAIIRVNINYADRNTLIELMINTNGINRAQLNRVPIKVRELPQRVQTITFAPEDLTIVQGEPATRRRTIDKLLIQRSPRLIAVFNDYERSLKQRNSLLKSVRSRTLSSEQLITLEIWDEKLINFGTEIIYQRQELLNAFIEPLTNAYQAIVQDDHLPTIQLALSILEPVVDLEDNNFRAKVNISSSEFLSSISPRSLPVTSVNNLSSTIPGIEIKQLSQMNISELFRSALIVNRRRELERGLTLVGPHRDDFVLGLNMLPARGYASHGESWSFALAFRLAAAKLLQIESTIGDPVIILDDVFAELDHKRRLNLATEVVKFEQVIITAAVAADIPSELSGQLSHIQNGKIITGSFSD